MTTKEIADKYDLTPQAISKAIRAGRLPARRVSLLYLIQQEDIEAYLKETRPDGVKVSKGKPKGAKNRTKRGTAE